MTRITQTHDHAIDVAADEAHATYRHGPSLAKPCVHPIVTPLGATLTGFEMSDHVWHRGLWFAIKFVDGENFWEEILPFGSQVSATQPTAQFVSDAAARVTHRLHWTSAASGTVIRETRTLDVARHRDGTQSIDWTSELTAERDQTWDRTPYTTWGGYGGLTFRASRELHDATFILPDGGSTSQLVGERHPWALLQGNLDGGPNRAAAIGIVDHPANPRATTPWYGKSVDGYGFLNAAFLFHEPMNVRQGQTLTFRYRVLYRDGHWTPDAFAALAATFRDAGI